MVSKVSGRCFEPPCVEVVIEISRGSFLKRGSSGHLDFFSPLPCPYNYGSVREYIGGEGDYLDAVVMGPRLATGSKVRMDAYGAVVMSERFMSDDKLICAAQPLTSRQRWRILAFFRFYAFCKGLLNLARGHAGGARCDGWVEAKIAIARAVPCKQGVARPKISF